MFQVGVNSLTCESDGIADDLQRIARHGFRNVEIWCNYAHLDPRLRPDVTTVGQVLKEEGLRAVSLHSPFEFRGEKLSVEDAWKAWEKLMSQVVETAEYLQVDFLVVHPVLVCNPSGSKQGDREVAPCREESLKRIAGLAARRGMRIALENLGRKTVADLAHPSEVMKLARRLGGDNIGVCFDTGHCLLSGLDPVRETDHCSSQVYSFHIHENDGVEDTHRVPGKGPVDWPRFFEKLQALQYGGSLILEIWGGTDGDGVLKDARAFVEQHNLT